MSGVTFDIDNAIAGAMSGTIAGVAFALAMQVDMRVFNNRLDDFRLLGELGPGAGHWRAKGIALHAANSAGLGIVYTLVADRLFGPAWLRGLTYAIIENTLLWPLTFLLDKRHPAILAGRLPRLNQPAAIAQEHLRHALYGVVLGWVYPRMRARQRRRSDARGSA